MDPFDPRQTAAVWARVYGGAWDKTPSSAPARDAAAAQPEVPPLSRRLSEMIADERQDSVTYYHMARMAGADAPKFRRIAQEEAGHARTLSALYVLLTGEHPPEQRYETGLQTDLSAMLSARYRGELNGAASYRRAAAQYPDQSDLFQMLAADEAEHARRILEIAELRL